MERYTLIEYIHRIQMKGLLLRHNCMRHAAFEYVENLAYDSKKTEKSTLFICKGTNFKERYLDAAISRGAIAYISEIDYNKKVPCILVNDIKKALALTAALFYNEPASELKLIGITGTKGKSTTAYYTKYILDEYLMAMGKPLTGIISSIDTYDGVINEESRLTTPESLELQMHFRNAVDSGMGYLVMEASSQAFKYGRLHDIMFDAGVFLNISEDHISPIEHSDMEDYMSSKLLIFKQSRTACVNLATDCLDRVLEAAGSSDKLLTFGLDEKADVYGYDIRKNGFDTIFNVRSSRFDKEFMLTMPGLFNVENALAAISAVGVMGIPEKYIYSGLRKARSSGRMEIYHNENMDRIVIVDYAHNKLSFNKLYETVRAEFPGKKIITVFGCPGGKAFVRRRDLGHLAGLFSDKVILTAEDPGMENIREISEDIARYIQPNNGNYEIIDDRGEAIKKSILSSEPDTVILITGKGSETRQKIGKEYIFYPPDADYAREYLKELDKNGIRHMAGKF